jgi:uncharacterized protein YeaO (DUF488 family)
MDMEAKTLNRPAKVSMKSLQIKRVYDNKETDGTYRVLVDRLWPRGIKKTDLHINEWNKELAPSTELRKWFDHKPERFAEFSKLYIVELTDKKEELDRLRAIAQKKTVTLLYGAKDPEINQAVILCNALLQRL